MERYIEQLLQDIAYATENVSFGFDDQNLDIYDWLPPEEEEMLARTRRLEEWTGIYKDALPPPEALSDDQVTRIVKALTEMLEAYNVVFVLQIKVPERIQYATIRDNFSQEVKVKYWHLGFFKVCNEGTEHKKCALGEYCECSLFAELFEGMVDEELSPEEERARQLEIEIKHLKQKYEDDWQKYYPYHLDAAYDDEDGNPYDYGIGDDEELGEDDDDWWNK